MNINVTLSENNIPALQVMVYSLEYALEQYKQSNGDIDVMELHKVGGTGMSLATVQDMIDQLYKDIDTLAGTNEHRFDFDFLNGHVAVVVIPNDMVFFLADGWDLNKMLEDVSCGHTNDGVYYNQSDLSDGYRYYTEAESSWLEAVPMTKDEMNKVIETIKQVDGIDA